MFESGFITGLLIGILIGATAMLFIIKYALAERYQNRRAAYEEDGKIRDRA